MEPSTYSQAATSVLGMALAMAEAGYPVAPVRITLKPDGRKEADCGGLSWSSVSTTDPSTIRGWFGPDGRFARWSYLIDTGKAGIVVVDLDVSPDKDGPAAWQRLGGPSSMMSVRTRGGGFHGYYRADPEIPLYNSTSAVADGVDIRATGGCVFGPGSFVEGYENDQVYRLMSVAPIPVDRLPVVPARALQDAMVARGKAQRLPDTDGCYIQRDQAYSNLLAASTAMVDTPIGYGLNTAIWRLGAEAGQYGAALGADESTVLAWVHERVLEHPQIDQLDSDDLRASQRGVSAGIEKPWIFFTLQELIRKDFNDAGVPLPATGSGVRSRLRTLAQMAAQPKPAPLIEGLIDAGKLAMIFGPGGSGKSFVALDMACCVATGRMWRGHRTTAGKVLYVAGEGGYGLVDRVHAWAVSNGVPDPEIDVMDALDLVGQVNPYDVDELVRVIDEEKYSLVVFDTYNRCTPGLEENSAKETGMVVSRLARIQAAGAAVLIVHHTPKDGSTPRGSAALEWATDHAFRVEKKDSAVTLVNHRQKDRVDGNAYSFVLAAVNGTESAALLDGVVEARAVVEPAFDVFVAVDMGIELETYSGAGASIIPELCKLMGQRATSGVGISRVEAAKALGRGTTDNSIRSAWNVLYVHGAIRTADGTRSLTGRCLWVPPGEQRHAELVSRHS